MLSVYHYVVVLFFVCFVLPVASPWLVFVNVRVCMHFFSLVLLSFNHYTRIAGGFMVCPSRSEIWHYINILTRSV